MKKATFIFIYDPRTVRAVPFGLLFIATYIKKRGYDIAIKNLVIPVNGEINENDWMDLKNDLKNSCCVGFSVMTNQVYRALQLSKKIKKEFKEIKIVWGGAHPTIYPIETCSNENIDFVVRGEGEKTFFELVEEINGKKDYSKVDGLVYKDGKAIVNKNRELIDLDELGMPDWNLIDSFVRENIYQYIWGKSMKHLDVHSGRGCPYRCNYCMDHIMYKRKRRTRNFKSVVDEFEFLIRNYNPDIIELCDDNFFLDLKYVENFCDEIIRRKLKILWGGNIRVNYFDRIDDVFMKKLKNSGCFQLWFSPESGSRRIINFIKKDITIEQVYKAVSMCKEHDIRVICSYMIGLPTETENEMRETIKLIKGINKIYKNACVLGPQIFRPYPGCEIYNIAVNRGFNMHKSLEDWNSLDENALFYLGADKMPWIKNPNFVNFVSKYSSKVYNTYMLDDKNLPFYFRFFLRLRFKMFEKGFNIYVNNSNRMLRKSIDIYMSLVDGASHFGRDVSNKLLGIFKHYR